MKRFNYTAPIAAAVAGGLLILGALASEASPGRQNPHYAITASVAEAGYLVDTNVGLCADSPHLFGYVQPARKHFVICTDNGYYSDRVFSTIRHEALHVAQQCKGGLLFPQDARLNVPRAIDEGFNPRSYPPSQLQIEAEARVMANELDAQEINALVRKHCNLKP